MKSILAAMTSSMRFSSSLTRFARAMTIALGMLCTTRTLVVAQARPDTLVTLAAGGRTTCLTTARGEGWCWGEIGFGRRTPIRMTDTSGRPMSLRSLSPFGWTVCGVTVKDAPVCTVDVTGGWVDSSGARVEPPRTCGRGCMPPLPMRGSIGARRVRTVTPGLLHACALAHDGSAHCWGHNHMGQLGTGAPSPDSTGSAGELVRAPKAVVGGLRFSQLDAGEQVTCGITVPEAGIYCWGYGQHGETGDSSIMTYCSGKRPYFNSPCSTSIPRPVRLEQLPGEQRMNEDVRFASVSAGMRLVCAVDRTGGAWCWGGNYRCALGRCRSPASPRAHRVALPGRAAEIGAGYWHACARTEERRVFCWGDNRVGQLGSPASANAGSDGLPPDYRSDEHARYGDPCFLGGRCSAAPVEVMPGRRWSALAVGTDHACALSSDDGGVYCWGGSDTSVFGASPRERCTNRSPDWPDVACQYTPVRVAGLPTLASPAARRDVPLPAPSVRVSRTEVRLTFPTDTTRGFGWSDRTDPDYRAAYSWAAVIEGMDGTRSLRLDVVRAYTDSSAREFPALAALVAAGEPMLCSTGMMLGDCQRKSVRAWAEGDRVEISLRDRAAITRLFGMRPAFVRLWHVRPDETVEYTSDSVRVAYVAPRIPAPDSATRADAARSRRKFESSIHWISRYIDGGSDPWRPLWLVVADSLPLRIAEQRCTYDVCSIGPEPVADSGWTIGDTSVAELRLPVPDTSSGSVELRYGAPTRRYVKARRPGRTTIRVVGLRGASDTAASQKPPEREITREVVVTRAVRRLHIESSTDTVVARTPVEVLVRAFDEKGAEIPGIPLGLTVIGDAGYQATSSEAMTVSFMKAGPGRIAVSLRGMVDTLRFTVVDSTARPLRH
jgi:alpha-tubulin suppressor-like RCC1 family protein